MALRPKNGGNEAKDNWWQQLADMVTITLRKVVVISCRNGANEAKKMEVMRPREMMAMTPRKNWGNEAKKS